MNTLYNEEDNYKIIMRYVCKAYNPGKRIIDDLVIDYNCFKEVIEKLNITNCDIYYLYNFLNKYKNFQNNEIRKIIFLKLSKLNDRNFRGFLYYENEEITYPFISLLNVADREVIFRRLWKTIGNYEDHVVKLFKEKEFINNYRKFCPKNLEYETIILNDIIKDILKFKDQEAIFLRLNLLYYFVGDSNKIKLGKEDKTKIFNEMSKDFNFTYLILNPGSYNQIDEKGFCPKYSFVNTNIVNNIGENNIIELLASMICSKEEGKKKYKFDEKSNKDINRMFTVIGNLAMNLDDKKQNDISIYNIVNRIFERQKYASNMYKTIVFLRYFSNSLFYYLTEENKKELINHILSEKTFDLCYMSLAKMIVNKEINKVQFDYIWKSLINGKCDSDDKIFLLVKSMIMLDGFKQSDDPILQVLITYLQNNKKKYLEYINKLDMKWSELEISYICDNEDVFGICDFLVKGDNFTKKQWVKVFNYFYNKDNFDPEKIYSSKEAYKSYHCNYIERLNPNRFVDDVVKMDYRGATYKKS